MKIQDLDLSKKYSYADYLKWRLEETVELIKGKVFRMSPAPGRYHQEISTNLVSRIEYFLRGGACHVFHAPFDVRLPLPRGQRKDDKIETVVQPDICVICDEEKLDPRGCLGAPDWIIEIVSPGSSKKDTKDKFAIYEAAGVQEYWLVYPSDQNIFVYLLNDDGQYVGLPPYAKPDVLSPLAFPGLKIPLNDVFPEIDLLEEEFVRYGEIYQHAKHA